jgi:hypothetical protein
MNTSADLEPDNAAFGVEVEVHRVLGRPEVAGN